jgi:hypothetical protein
MSNPECLNGWIEVLHFKHDPKELHKAKPIISNTYTLKNFSEEHYEMVGSVIPLCEYNSAFELYRQFTVPVDEEFRIPRIFRTYDAINLCLTDKRYGRKITTLVVWNKGQHHNLGFREQRVQYHPDYPHCLVIRQRPFRSFAPRIKK